MISTTTTPVTLARNGQITACRDKTDMTGDAGSRTEFRWNAIIYFYCLYFGIVFAGAVAGYRATYVGAAVFLCLFYAKYWAYLFRARIDALAFCIFFSLLLPLVPLASYDQKTFFECLQELVKYYSLNLLIFMGMSLPLTPIGRSKRSWLLHVTILLFLILGWFWPGGQGMLQSRVKGFLPNPNGFALTAIMLLCLLREEPSGRPLRWANHLIVLGLIYVSKTSGALIGYMVAMAYRFVFEKRGRLSLGRLSLLLAGCAMLTAVFLAIPLNTLLPIDNTIRKFQVTKENAQKILSGRKIDYLAIIEKEKGDVTSGVWRLYQWQRIFDSFRNSSLDRQLFGAGIGTSDLHFGLKPHNDYLRILYETGIIGFLINMAIWVMIYRRMDVRYRWVVVMVAFFSITENNYDHFPAMSLLCLYMIGAHKAMLRRATGESSS